jgi:hypothetical protein
MKTNVKTLFFVIMLFGFALAACKGDEEAPSAEDTVAEIYTSVAQTVAARPSDTAQPTATRLLSTPVPLPSFTPPSGGNGNGNGNGNGGGNGIPTLTPPPSSQPLCKDAIYMQDITVPDGTIFAPGEGFEKTWLIFNGGTCTWEADYVLSFLSGEEMSGIPHPLGNVVPPNTQVEVSVSMTAPLVAGSYTGYWQMTDSEGTKFGNAFYVIISVSGDATVTSTPTQTFTATPVPTEEYTPTPTLTDTPVPSETPTIETTP